MISDIKSILGLLTSVERWKLVFLLCLMLTSGFLEAISVGIIPLYIAFLMRPSSLSENEWGSHIFHDLPDVVETSLIIKASLLLLVFTVGKNSFLAFVYYVQSRIAGMQRARLANRMFQAYQKAPYDWLSQRSTSELQRNIENDTTQILSGVIQPVLDLILATVLSISVITVLVLATPGSTLIGMLIIGFGLFGVTTLLRKRLNFTGEIARREYRRAIKSIQQGFGALVDARIIGCESFLVGVHRESVVRSAQANIVRGTLTKITPLLIETIAVLGLLTVLIIILSNDTNLLDALPVLSVLGIAIIRLKQMASKIAGGINMINASRPYIPAVLADLKRLKQFEAEQSTASDPTAAPIEKFENLEVDTISYTYPDNSTPALNNISISLRKGESIAFIGATGCGKSTLVNCILGLLTPQKGNIYVNNTEIRNDLKGWLNCLGYIPQVIYLIDDTLRANIAFGVKTEDIDEQRLRSALDSAALTSFVETLEKGLDTQVGERGVRLSGGQRQRLGIARALYFNPEILVMDEATSALDNQTENEVMQAIQNLKRERTLIIIAHRLSTVEDCDRLYLLKEGTLIESGTYSELIENSIEFKDLAAISGKA
ncbi:MAG: ABC transporter ATP-binding protein [Opitutaceae bacterium]